MECKLTWMHSSASSEKWTKRELHFSPTLREFWVKTRDAQRYTERRFLCIP